MGKNMKNRFLIVGIFVILITVGLTGCMDERLKGLDYVNTDYQQDFGFNPPEGWTKDEDDPYGVVRFYGDIVDDFNMNLGLTEPGALGEGETLGSLAQDVEDNISKYFTEFNLVSSQYVTINGMQSYEIVYSYVQGIYNLQNKQVLVMKNNIIYIFTFAASQNSYNDYVSIVDQSINTFTVV
jgi:hypothetical protein